MFHVVLFQPEIPQNTGNVGRTCAITGSRLHLIHPLGFSLADRYLKRSGMDYWPSLDLHEHDDWDAFRASDLAPERLWMLSTHGDVDYWDVRFEKGDGFLFGNEGSGCPEHLHEAFKSQGRRLRIPHHNKNLRSLNLSASVAVVVFEAMRQRANRNAGKKDSFPGNSGVRIQETE